VWPTGLSQGWGEREKVEQLITGRGDARLAGRKFLLWRNSEGMTG